MKILVPVKRVIDPYIPVRIDENELHVVSENMPHAMNPFDEIALNEACNLKNELPNLIKQVTAVSIGSIKVEETLGTALAMGADRAIHILSEQSLEPLTIAKILQTLVGEIKPDLVLMGKQSVDGDNGQTGPMLAGLLGWPQACNAAKILLAPSQVPEDGFSSVGPGLARDMLTKRPGEPHYMIVTREVEQGLDTIAGRLPVLVTCDLRLNEPRPVGLAAVIKARQKNIEQRPLADFLSPPHRHIETLQIFEPPAREPCDFLDDAVTLVTRLKQREVI